MPETKQINIHHLTRVEGHGDLIAVIRDGELEQARFDIVEAPRFFEFFLRGHAYAQVTHMASRICGICSISHRCAAIQAVEAAFGVKINERIRLLRRLAFHGEVIGSHVLHLFFLAAPDILGVPSMFHLPADQKQTVLRAMGLKRTANAICSTVAGRHIHPVGMEAGGFSFNPSIHALKTLRGTIQGAISDLKALLPLFRDHAWPDFERETTYISLSHPRVYAFYEGDLHAGQHGPMALRDYRRIIREYTVPGSNAKHASHDNAPYMVGALARFNNNHRQLNTPALETADALGLTAPCANPFKIPAAQLVETVHCLWEALDLIDRLLDPETVEQDLQVPVRPTAARGVGAVEAPRGTLFHDYAFDDQGLCGDANLVIPTAQNLANLQADMQAFVPPISDQPEDELAGRLSVLVRAYDPCISCATHVIKLDSRNKANKRGDS